MYRLHFYMKFWGHGSLKRSTLYSNSQCIRKFSSKKMTKNVRRVPRTELVSRGVNAQGRPTYTGNARLKQSQSWPYGRPIPDSSCLYTCIMSSDYIHAQSGPTPGISQSALPPSFPPSLPRRPMPSPMCLGWTFELLQANLCPRVRYQFSASVKTAFSCFPMHKPRS